MSRGMADGPSFIPAFDFARDVLARWDPASAEGWNQSACHDTAMTVVMGFLVAAACGWIGCYLILQGMALVGDAISHTVLLGIVVAFLLTGQVSGAATFIGAAVTGLLTTVLIEGMHRTSRIKEDAAIGIVFTSLFALGVVLLSTFAGRAHIDTQHVLYGNLEFFTSGPQSKILGIDVPVPLCEMACIAAGLVALIAGFYKELLVVSFDPQLAASLGIAPRLVRFSMMAVLSLTVVTAFTSVGAILVVAMLMVPPATAYLLTHRLPLMFLLSTVTGGIASLVGYHAGYWLEVSITGAIVSIACGLFAAAFLFAPGQGLVAGLVRRWRLRMRMSQENIVRHMLKLSGGAPRAAVTSGNISAAVQTSRLNFQWAIGALERRGWVEAVPDSAGLLRLTDRGFLQAQRLDRAHRLWETFLVEQVGIPSDHVHPTAEKVEHLLSEQLVERVDDVLGHPVTDPHGSPIPRSVMTDRSPGVFTLSKLRAGDRARIVGLIDRPVEETKPAADSRAYAAVAAVGLTLGQGIEVVGHDPAVPSWTIRDAAGGERRVPHELADLVLVELESRL